MADVVEQAGQLEADDVGCGHFRRVAPLQRAARRRGQEGHSDRVLAARVRGGRVDLGAPAQLEDVGEPLEGLRVRGGRRRLVQLDRTVHRAVDAHPSPPSLVDDERATLSESEKESGGRQAEMGDTVQDVCNQCKLQSGMRHVTVWGHAVWVPPMNRSSSTRSPT